MTRIIWVVGLVLATAVPAGAEEDARKKFFVGASMFEAGEFAQAIPYLDESLALDPDFCRAHYYRARCFIEIGDDKDAAEGAAGDFERCASGGEAEDIAELWGMVDDMPGGGGGRSSRDDDDDGYGRSSRDDEDDDDGYGRSSRDDDDDFYASERWTDDEDEDDRSSRSSKTSKGKKGKKGKRSSRDDDDDDDRSSRSSRDDEDDDGSRDDEDDDDAYDPDYRDDEDDDDDDDASRSHEDDDDGYGRSSRYDEDDDDGYGRSSRDDEDSWQDESDRWSDDEDEPVVEDDWRDDEDSYGGGSRRSSGGGSATLKKRRTVGAVMTFSGVAAGVAGFALTGYFYHYYFNMRNDSDAMNAWFMGTQSGGITLGAVGTLVGLTGVIVWAAPAKKGASVSVAPGPVTMVAVRF